MNKFLSRVNLVSGTTWRRWPLFLALALVLLLPAAAPANIITVGGPNPIGSWTQAFQETTKEEYPFTKMVITSDSILFKAPGFMDLPEGWSTNLSEGTATTVVATGLDTSYAEFKIYFDTETDETFTFTFEAWGNIPNMGETVETVLDSATLSWNGEAWNVDCTPTAYSYDVALVPLPGALVLLGAGLVRLAAYGRRRK